MHRPRLECEQVVANCRPLKVETVVGRPDQVMPDHRGPEVDLRVMLKRDVVADREPGFPREISRSCPRIGSDDHVVGDRRAAEDAEVVIGNNDVECCSRERIGTGYGRRGGRSVRQSDDEKRRASRHK